MKRTNRLTPMVVGVLLLIGCKEKETVISLAGQWDIAIDSTDTGISDKYYSNRFKEKILLPGTMDGAGYGTPNKLLPSINKPQILHLTRNYSYVGPTWYIREVVIPQTWNNKNIELNLERVIWQTNVWVDGKSVAGEEESLVSPHTFDLSKHLTPGTHQIAIRVDNRKKYDITSSDMAHAYTNHTQTMWNGILGEMTLKAKDNIIINHLQVYPNIKDNNIRIKGTLTNTDTSRTGHLFITVKRKKKGGKTSEMTKPILLPAGQTNLDVVLPMEKDVQLWSEFTPAMYQLNLTVKSRKEKAEEQIEFGMRQITREATGISINGDKTFFRGTLECCIFPLTGTPPTTKKGWLDVYQSARQWGINHLRFHSWCPPKAAFQVADSLGFYLQVELPLWSLSVGTDSKMNRFLYEEAERILAQYGNHPSFCFFSLGNELQSDFAFLGKLLNTIKTADPRHLYTTTSFTFEGGHGDKPEPDDDFLITQWTKKGWVRGQGVFETETPRFNRDYSTAVADITVPIITHEIGQYAVYPDLKEIDKYTGVLNPLNFKGVKQDLEKKGLLHKADDYLKASGRLAYLLYKEEIERALKTPGISGYQLLDLHDFPGQGTALVGLLNAFWESKGVADAEEFRQFAAPVVPLVRYSKAVYKNNETFTASIEIANYSPEKITGKNAKWTLSDKSGQIITQGTLSFSAPQGKTQTVGNISCPLAEVKSAKELKLTVAIEGTDYQNSWNVWVYPATLIIDKGNILVTDKPAEALQALEEGQTVLLNPPYKSCVGLQGKFLPVFWSPVHFPKQAGTMGLLLDHTHRAFAHFPTEDHTSWQWWRMTTESRTLVVDSFHQQLTPLVEYVDNFANNRRLTTLFEAQCMKGKLLMCSMDLLNNQEIYPEKKQLLYSLIDYMKSKNFHPTKTISPENIMSLICPDPEVGRELPN